MFLFQSCRFSGGLEARAWRKNTCVLPAHVCFEKEISAESQSTKAGLVRYSISLRVEAKYMADNY